MPPLAFAADWLPIFAAFAIDDSAAFFFASFRAFSATPLSPHFSRFRLLRLHTLRHLRHFAAFVYISIFFAAIGR